jgi:Eukaryotic protein of unknown function (DUF866)
MVLYALSVKADLENLESLTFPEDHHWIFSFEDEMGHRREDVVISTELEIKRRYWKGNPKTLLRFPQNPSPARISILSSERISSVYKDSGEFQRVMVLDCRSCRWCTPVKWSPSGFYVATTKSGKEFPEVDLQKNDWVGFDEDQKCQVRVHNVEYKWEKIKAEEV